METEIKIGKDKNAQLAKLTFKQKFIINVYPILIALIELVLAIKNYSKVKKQFLAKKQSASVALRHERDTYLRSKEISKSIITHNLDKELEHEIKKHHIGTMTRGAEAERLFNKRMEAMAKKQIPISKADLKIVQL